MPLSRGIIRAVRVYQGGHLRDFLAAHQVVVDDNHLQSNFRGTGQGVMRRRAAIHRNDQLRAPGLQSLERRRRGPVALENAIRDIDRQV